ncbi:MAG: hypothetical protein ABI343_15020 [Burkholderiaceae bacterium]
MFKAPVFPALVLALSLGCMGLASAQNNPPVAPAASTAAPEAPGAKTPDGGPIEQRIEHIHIEDSAARIDELRVGGETQSITVSPKGGMPAYEVIPNTGNRGPATAERSNGGATGGTRVWNILKF